MTDWITFWQFISFFGDLEFWLGIGVASILIYRFIPKRAKHYLHWQMFGMLPSVIIASIITYLTKIILQVPRPCDGALSCPADYSFPSGHATVIFAAMSLMFFIDKRPQFKILYLLFAILVSVSRIALGFHTWIDIIVGAIIGTASGYISYRNHKVFIKFLKNYIK